jgi:hypothetical protein
MTKAKRTLALLVLNSALGHWATPSAAHEAGAASPVCREDVICVRRICEALERRG